MIVDVQIVQVAFTSICVGGFGVPSGRGVENLFPQSWRVKDHSRSLQPLCI
jgi:hypothetical protein